MKMPDVFYVYLTDKREDIKISYQTCREEKQCFFGCSRECFFRGRYFFSANEKTRLNKGTLILKKEVQL